jgi:hypothetical protein
MEKAVSLEQDLVEQKRLGMTTNAEAAKWVISLPLMKNF